MYNNRVALFKNGGGGGNRTDLPSASDNAPVSQVHCNTVRSENPTNGTLAGALQTDCTSMQKDNAISMPNDLAAVVAIWPKLSDDQKTQVLAIVKARIA
jgi:hypothetical protein